MINSFTMNAIQPVSAYLKLYKYLLVLSEEQLVKLRRIATGALQLSAFTEEEMKMLESKLHLQH